MWVSRRQAQNVADAGALAGALAMIFDGGSPLVVNQAAQHWAANNPIWGQGNSALNVEVTLSSSTVNIPPCGAVNGCVRVDVMRNMPDRAGVLRGNALPTYFAQLVGRSDQGVRATATAETAAGNQIKCMLPFAVADRWADSTDENVDTSTYTTTVTNGAASNHGWSPMTCTRTTQCAAVGQYAPPSRGLRRARGQEAHGWTWPRFGRQLVRRTGKGANLLDGRQGRLPVASVTPIRLISVQRHPRGDRTVGGECVGIRQRTTGPKRRRLPGVASAGLWADKTRSRGRWTGGPAWSAGSQCGLELGSERRPRWYCGEWWYPPKTT